MPRPGVLAPRNDRQFSCSFYGHEREHAEIYASCQNSFSTAPTPLWGYGWLWNAMLIGPACSHYNLISPSVSPSFQRRSIPPGAAPPSVPNIWVDPNIAERINLPDNCGNVARQALPQVIPGNPGDRRKCAKLAQHFPQSCRQVALEAEIRPKFDRIWPCRT